MDRRFDHRCKNMDDMRMHGMRPRTFDNGRDDFRANWFFDRDDMRRGRFFDFDRDEMRRPRFFDFDREDMRRPRFFDFDRDDMRRPRSFDCDRGDMRRNRFFDQHDFRRK